MAASQTAADPPGFDASAFTQRVHDSLAQAERYTRRLQKNDNLLSLTGILGGASMTLLTGWTSAAGPLMGSSVEAWRLTCIIAALLGFISTVSMGLSQQLRLSDRLSKGNECIGRLKSLDFSIVAGNQPWKDIAAEYAAILRSFPEVLR